MPMSLLDTAEGEPVVAGLRQVGGLLGDRDAGLLVYAVALEAWHSHPRVLPALRQPYGRAGGWSHPASAHATPASTSRASTPR